MPLSLEIQRCQHRQPSVAIFSEDGLTGGAISAYVRDPDGNLIELEQWLS